MREPMLRSQRISISALLAGAILAGCASASSGQPSDAEIQGTWVLLEAQREGEAILGYDGDEMPWLSFDDGQMAGFDGCNSLSSDYEFTEGGIQFPQIFSTLSSCLGSTNTYLEAFAALSDADLGLSVRDGGDELVLRTGPYLLTFRMEAADFS